MPIATTKGGIAFAFPDVCKTPAPPSPTPIPIPYPNIGQLSAASNVSDTSTGTGEVKAGGNHVILAQTSEIPNTMGDQPGSAGGVKSGTTGGKVEFTAGSKTVEVHGKEVVRMMDPTTQNKGNAVGMVLGGVPNILVGG
jgi:uncharacterized protein DUF4150